MCLTSYVISQLPQDEIANAWPTFCPALPEGSPTIAPRSNEPTLTPSKSPTLKPSAMSIPPSPPSPTTSNDGVIPNDSSVHHDQHTMSINFMAFSKSSKHTKTHKPAKASKGSSKSGKHSKSKSSKSSKGSKKYLNSQVVGYDVSSSDVCTRSGLALVMSVFMAGALFLC